MPQYTLNERIWLVQQYYKSYGKGRNGEGPSIAYVRRTFKDHFHKKPPTTNNTMKIIHKFQDSGNIENANKGHSGRRRTSRTNDNTGRVMDKVLSSPRKSIRRLSRELDLSPTSVFHMVHDIGAYSYKIQVMQKLTPNDFRLRSQFCARTLANTYEDPGFLQRWWWSDECHVQLDGQVNKQNLRFLGWEKPQEYEMRPLHSERVTVWCAMSSHAIIGPYFIEGNMNAHGYREILDRFTGDLQTYCEVYDLDYHEQIFQQDGAPTHTGKGNLQYAEELFPGRLISRLSPYEYPPRSPDLTLPDAFLWGILKEKCFCETIPRTLAQLRLNIEHVIDNIADSSLHGMVRNIEQRLELCLMNEGAHIEHIIA